MTNLFDPARVQLSDSILKVAQQYCQDLQLSFQFSQEEIGASLERPPESEMGDYAFPCFKFAKSLRQSPNTIAGELGRRLDVLNNPWIARVEVKNAFLNLFISPSQLALSTIPRVLDDSFFDLASLNPANSAVKTMIEFSQPNTHKEFHVGHGRNVCLGDSLVRIFRYAGFSVIPVNYIGDEGTHVAKCIWAIKRYQGEGPQQNKAEWYGQRYVEATRLLAEADAESKTAYESEISIILRDIEGQNGENYQIWKKTRQDCLESFDEIYSWLGVKFDHFFFESEVSHECQTIVDEFIEKGLFVESDGAYGIDMKDDKLGFFMVRKRDGNSLYITKDLALARRKFRDFEIKRSIYVVGDEQSFHFRQLFKALELMGFPEAKQCHHLAYGMVVRPDGKMSSRKGNSFTFFQLKSFVEGELRKHLAKYDSIWTADQIEATAAKLTLGSIKYGMLATDPSREIVFDPSQWVSFEGDSGPYLMYAFARTQSILTKAKQEGHEISISNLGVLSTSEERNLIRYIYDFNDTVLGAARLYKPSIIAHYLFEMCKQFNRFYRESPVLKAEDKDLISARLALVAAFSKTLKVGLELLGIETVDKM